MESNQQLIAQIQKIIQEEVTQLKDEFGAQYANMQTILATVSARQEILVENANATASTAGASKRVPRGETKTGKAAANAKSAPPFPANCLIYFKNKWSETYRDHAKNYVDKQNSGEEKSKFDELFESPEHVKTLQDEKNDEKRAKKAANIFWSSSLATDEYKQIVRTDREKAKQEYDAKNVPTPLEKD